jgi:glycosyltransferase involved in cell wall biosynthesis
MESKVSVIITTYNRPEYLPFAINSVITQTHKNLEIIVVNDAGQDVSDIVKSFDDNRIKYINKSKNAGLGAARNTGLDNATGKFVNFLDDDDQFYPFHIQTLVEFLERYNYKFGYTDCVCHVMEKKDGEYRIVNRTIVYSIDYDEDTLLFQNIVPVLGVMYELDDNTRKLRLNESVLAYEDWLHWLEISKHYPMHHLAIPTCMYTFRHDGSTMSSSRNDFTTLLPGIFKDNFPRAKNQFMVAKTMNYILEQRKLPVMFQFSN